MYTEKVFIKRCQKHGERDGEIKGDRNTSSRSQIKKHYPTYRKCSLMLTKPDFSRTVKQISCDATFLVVTSLLGWPLQKNIESESFAEKYKRRSRLWHINNWKMTFFFSKNCQDCKDICLNVSKRFLFIHYSLHSMCDGAEWNPRCRNAVIFCQLSHSIGELLQNGEDRGDLN